MESFEFSALGADGPTLALGAPPVRTFAGVSCHLGLVGAAVAAAPEGSAGATDGNEAEVAMMPDEASVGSDSGGKCSYLFALTW